MSKLSEMLDKFTPPEGYKQEPIRIHPSTDKVGIIDDMQSDREYFAISRPKQKTMPKLEPFDTVITSTDDRLVVKTVDTDCFTGILTQNPWGRAVFCYSHYVQKVYRNGVLIWERTV